MHIRKTRETQERESKTMEKTNRGMGGAVALAVGALLAGCQCTPPVRECVETRTVTDVSKDVCAPVKVVECPTGAKTSTVTVIRRTEDACAALPPVGEITVTRSVPMRTKMVFVYVKPTDDRCFNIESQNFERPWPWGAYEQGNGSY